MNKKKWIYLSATVFTVLVVLISFLLIQSDKKENRAAQMQLEEYEYHLERMQLTYNEMSRHLATLDVVTASPYSKKNHKLYEEQFDGVKSVDHKIRQTKAFLYNNTPKKKNEKLHSDLEDLTSKINSVKMAWEGSLNQVPFDQLQAIADHLMIEGLFLVVEVEINKVSRLRN